MTEKSRDFVRNDHAIDRKDGFSMGVDAMCPWILETFLSIWFSWRVISLLGIALTTLWQFGSLCNGLLPSFLIKGLPPIHTFYIQSPCSRTIDASPFLTLMPFWFRETTNGQVCMKRTYLHLQNVHYWSHLARYFWMILEENLTCRTQTTTICHTILRSSDGNHSNVDLIVIWETIWHTVWVWEDPEIRWPKSFF